MRLRVTDSFTMRDYINSVTRLTESMDWPETISGIDLADRIQREDMHHTPEDWIDGDIDENICAYGTYHLRAIDPKKLNPDHYYNDDDLVQQYAEQQTSAPPIILGHDLHIIDGAHRTKAALLRGDDQISAYVGDEATYTPPEEDENDDD